MGISATDLLALYDLTIHPFQCPYKIPLRCWGPIPSGTVGLILSRSILSLKGITVHTAVIDEDSTGEITVMMTIPLEWTF